MGSEAGLPAPLPPRAGDAPLALAARGESSETRGAEMRGLPRADAGAAGGAAADAARPEREAWVEVMLPLVQVLRAFPSVWRGEYTDDCANTAGSLSTGLWAGDICSSIQQPTYGSAV